MFDIPDGYILMLVMFIGAYILHIKTVKINLTKMLHDDMDIKSRWLFR